MNSHNKDNEVIRSSEYIIIDKDGILNEISKEANNLYNAALYQIRQRFLANRFRNKKNKREISYRWLNEVFKNKFDKRENLLYGKLKYTQSAQQTLKEVNTIWYAFFKALKSYQINPSKFTGRPKMPSYLPKGKRHTFYVTNQVAKNKNGYLVIPRFNLKIKLNKRIVNNNCQIKRVAFKPLNKNKFKMLVQYKTYKRSIKPDNGVYVGIDPGMNNAFTCVTNSDNRPLIINGRGVKSINQFYNKKKAELQKKHAQYGQCYKVGHTKQGDKKFYYPSEAIKKITEWRNTRIKQFAHKASKGIIEYALSCGANTIVIGKNKGLKRSSNLGKRINQNFIGIPHNMMVNMIKYKAEEQGIRVIETNESYTSQTSFLDNEKPCRDNGEEYRKKKQLTPYKRRIKRGLFKSNDGTLINADVNGAFQIIRKVFPKVSIKNLPNKKIILSPYKWNMENKSIL